MTVTKVAKWFGLGLLSFVLLIVLLVVGVVAYLGGTQSGTRQLLEIGKGFAPGELVISEASGTLLDQLTLQGVSYQQDNGLRVTLPKVHLDWAPSTLFSKHLHIIELAVEQPTIVLPVPAAEEPPVDDTPLFPITLPSIEIPLSVAVDNLVLSDVTLQPTLADGTPGVVQKIDELVLQAHTDHAQLVIDRVAITAPQGHAEVAGKITPSADYPMDLSLSWGALVPEKGELQGAGTLNGTLNTLQLEQSISGLLAATITSRLDNLLTAPQGQLNINDLAVDLGIAAPDFSGQTVTGSAAVNFDLQSVVIESLALLQTQSKGEINLSGQVSGLDEKPAFDVKGAWKGLRFPLTGDALLAGSDQGAIDIKGPLDNYRIALSSEVHGDAVPHGAWQLTAKGSQNGFREFALNGKTLEGQVSIAGAAQWLPSVNWKASLRTEGINPGAQWPEWPGKLSTQLESQGQINANGALVLTANLQELKGQLRGQAVNGKGKVSVKGDVVDVEQLSLSMAGAKLTTQGSLGETLDLDWMLDAPKLADLLPNASGSIQGKGTVKGTAKAPVVKGLINGDEIQMASNRLDHLSAEVDLNLAPKQQSTVSLIASKVSLGGQKWSEMSLQGKGTPEQHQLAVKTQQGEVDLSLALNGGWKEPQWAGTLTELVVDNEIAGQWLLGNDVAIKASAEQIEASQLCLNRKPAGSGAACVKGTWSAKNGAKGAATLKEISLALLEPFMPAGTVTQGMLQASSDFSLPPGKNPIFDVSATIQKGLISIEDQDLTISTGDVLVTVIGEKETLTANLQVPLLKPAGDISSKITVNDLYNQGLLNGSFKAQLSDLKFISLFAPQIQAVKGQVNSELSFSGTMTEPKVLGFMELQNGSAEVPALGIVVNPIKLNIKDQNGTEALNIVGSLTSEEGTLNVVGRYEPLAGKGNVTLKGDRFLAMGTKEIQVWISPDLQVDLDPKLIKLRGELVVPEANITPPKSTGENATSVSSDVVVVQELSDLDKAPKGPALDAQLRLTLGDKVNVDAYGFTGRLLGSILIEDDGRQATRATGNMDVAAGEYRLYGQDLTIERGSVVFTGGPIDNPGLDLRVSRTISGDEVTVGAQVSGTINNPRFDLYSSPSMPESSQLSYLMFGRAPGTGSSSEQAMLYRAAAALAMKGGNSIAENINETLQLDDFGLEGDSASETALFIGKYLSPRLYVKYGVGLLEPTSTFFLRYKLSSRWDFESQTGTKGSGGDLIYTLER